MLTKSIIISLGGSLIAPPIGINYAFLKKFRVLISSEIKKGRSFFVVTGGGVTARNYISSAKKITKLTPEDYDWLGIHATRLNAQLLRTIFRDIACPEIITNPTQKLSTGKHLIFAGGYRPGRSTDYVAVMLAQKYGAKKIINLSNIDYVYDRDPKKFKTAKKLEAISWKDFQKIVGTKWDPGMNAPFDPVASALASRLKLEVAIINGKNLTELKKYLEGKKFRGTVVS